MSTGFFVHCCSVETFYDAFKIMGLISEWNYVSKLSFWQVFLQKNTVSCSFAR